MRAIAGRLTYANVAATLALILALGGGVAYAANTIFSEDIVDGEVKTQDVLDDDLTGTDIREESLTGVDASAVNGAGVCRTPRVLTMNVGDPDVAICTVGSLTVLATCTTTGGSVFAGLILDTSTDNAFFSSRVESANFDADDPPKALIWTFDSFGRGASVNEEPVGFVAAEGAAAGGRHLEGSAVLRALRRQDVTLIERCQFAVSALTS